MVDGESDADLDIANGTDLAYTTQTDNNDFDLGAGMGDDMGVSEPAKKYHVKGVPVKVMAQRIQYYDTDGKLVTESFQDYTAKPSASSLLVWMSLPSVGTMRNVNKPLLMSWQTLVLFGKHCKKRSARIWILSI